MNLFSLLGHASLLIHIGKDVESIIQNLVQHKENFPSKEEFLKLLDDGIQLLSSGILGLPEDVNKKLVDSFNGVKAGLVA